MLEKNISANSASAKKVLLSAAFLALSVGAQQSPALAESTSAEDLTLAAEGRALQANDFDSMHSEATVDLAQARRRGASSATRPSDFIGVGANVGFVNDVSGVAISKFSFADRWAIRPSLSVGDDFAVLVPVTYQFDRYAANVGGARLSPYAGLGASWANENNNDNRKVSDAHLLISAGVDVPISRRFTVNAQANLGVFNDTEFGATVGVGYNIGNIFE